MEKTFQLSCLFTLVLALSGCSGDADDANPSSTGGTSSGGQSSTNSAGKSGAGTTTGMPGKPGEVGGCQMFPAEDAWNLDISGVAVDASWTKTLHDLVGTANIHPDYGVDGQDLYGIPLNVVPATQALAPITFDDYPDESDPGPYPFPGPGIAI